MNLTEDDIKSAFPEMADSARSEVEPTEEVVEEVVAEEQVEAQPEYSEIEQEAMSKGWKPEGVPGKPNKSAEEFLAFEEKYSEVEGLKKTVKKQDKLLKDLVNHMSEFRAMTYSQAKEELLSKTQYDAQTTGLDADALEQFAQNYQALEQTKSDIEHIDDSDQFDLRHQIEENMSRLTPEESAFVEKYKEFLDPRLDSVPGQPDPIKTAIRTHVGATEQKLIAEGVTDKSELHSKIEQEMLDVFHDQFSQKSTKAVPKVSSRKIVGKDAASSKIPAELREVFDAFADDGVDLTAKIAEITKG